MDQGFSARASWASAVSLSGLLILGCSQTPEGAAEDHEKRIETDVEATSAALRSLPYASWVPVAPGPTGGALQGVTLHDPERVAPGLNLFAPRHLSEAFLIDLEGEVVHRWKLSVGHRGWQHVELLPGGDLLVIAKDRALARLSWDSQLKAVYRLRFHHDVDVGEDGRIFVPSRQERLVQMDGKAMLLLDDRVTILAPSGEVESHLSLFDHFGHLVSMRRREIIFAGQAERKTVEAWRQRGGKDLIETRELQVRDALCPPGSPCDVFHLNSVELLDREVPALGPAGSLLISVRELNRIAVIDPESGNVTWAWGHGRLEAQHHPTVLENGHVLVFDNGSRRGYSRILEVDPASDKIVWQYQAPSDGTFFSRSRGASQRLPGGNTLITESDFGHVFEITPGGEIVWQFFSPFVHREQGKMKRSAIYRMMRVTDLEAWGIDHLLAGEL